MDKGWRHTRWTEVLWIIANICKFGKHQYECFCWNFLTDEIVLPPIEYGCGTNNDCPDYTACQNRKCINPCAEDNVCAPNAICTVTRHKAICACPDGYIGSPEISCSLRKYKYRTTKYVKVL